MFGGRRGFRVGAPATGRNQHQQETMSSKRYTIWATRQTRYGNERVLPGEKIDGVTEDEMPGLMSSGRFTTEEPTKAEKPAKAEKAKADA